MIAARQIGPADTVPEKDVPADEESLWFTIKADTTRRMTGEEKDIQPVVS